MSLTFEEVLSFPQEARDCFGSQPEVYQQFLDVVCKYAAEEYGLFNVQICSNRGETVLHHMPPNECLNQWTIWRSRIFPEERFCIPRITGWG